MRKERDRRKLQELNHSFNASYTTNSSFQCVVICDILPQETPCSLHVSHQWPTQLASSLQPPKYPTALVQLVPSVVQHSEKKLEQLPEAAQGGRTEPPLPAAQHAETPLGLACFPRELSKSPKDKHPMHFQRDSAVKLAILTMFLRK